MMKIKNIEATANRIRKAIEEKEKIVLYGDADMDGTSSVVILKESIEAIGGKIFYSYFPDRGKEGYGLNDGALKFIKDKVGDDKILLIVMDCGISNFEEARTAKKLGIDLIIIDHHQPHDKLPEALIIVDPKQEGDEYPFKDFANTGIIFKLAEELTGDIFNTLRKSFSELAALATIADMMRQEEDNKKIIKEGLKNLKDTERLGLKVFWTERIFKEETLIKDIAQKIVSVLGASDVVDHKTEAYTILTSEDKDEIKNLIIKLIEKNNQKQALVAEMVKEVSEKVSPDDVIIFYGKEGWAIPLLGSTGSKLENIFKKPVFLYSKSETTSRGAVRMPKGINAVDVMAKSSDILIEYGGHPPAAGFNIDNDKLAEFEENLREYFKK